MVSIIPKIEQLSPRIIRVLGCNPGPMTLQGTNTYIVGTGLKRALIDTGDNGNADYISALGETLRDHKIQISDVIITHWHHDHIGGLCDVLNSTNRDANVFKMPLSEHDDPLPDWVKSSPLKHLQEIAVEGATLRAHHTPGHTQDHMVLELTGSAQDSGIFTGDCILGEGTAVFEDLFDYMKSLDLLLGLGLSTLYPGHGPVITDGMDKIRFYINHRNQREEQILKTLLACDGSTATPPQLVKIVYKDVAEHLHLAAENNLRHHLTKLVKEGKVKLAEDDKYTALQSIPQNKL